MKKNIIYLLTLFVAISACSDDFTELPAIGSLSDEEVQNEDGVELLLIGAYSTLDGIRNNLSGNGFAASGDNWWFDVIADDAHKGSTDGDQADLFEMEVYNWTTANPYVLGKWSSIFAGVNRANAVIALIATIEDADLNAQLAEARFLRGHFNFELQRIYGNVPYISEDDYANTEFNQTNSGPIWDEIEADFQFAVDNLPDSQGLPGKPSSWTAKAYLGKVHLQQNEWTAAFDLLEDVINNGPYSLNSEFLANFESEGENSSEAVFSIQFTADSGQSLNGNIGGVLNFPNPGPFGSCCGFYQPSQDLVNAFQTDADGLPLLDTFNEANNDVTNDYGIEDEDAFTPHTGPLDPRLDYTVGRRGIDYNGYGTFPGHSWIRATFSDISGPYLPAKNVYQSGDSDNQGTGAWGQQHSGINYHIIRFADVLLMGAEAAVETNDLTSALTWVNLVRNRAKNMEYVQNEAGDADAANYVIEPYTSFDDQAFARKAVRHERRLELGMEGHRLFDLRRWGNSVEVINEYIVNESRTITNFGTKANTFEAKHDMLPIPLTAIDLSGGILEQNPGY
ncbi:RagB/SusD family nutrient uptake outer membrane protein [Maribacter aquivivus]|uniref:RagB/SusD family nutrient uptake outer membrane protein n=1 Tax=Maribacter aquivivus TaxID=228958 RepID=UPI0024902D6C|nr:RagB/SusD family nutrient uptake outer membrane protein [Maribacter aquivivus]